MTKHHSINHFESSNLGLEFYSQGELFTLHHIARAENDPSLACLYLAELISRQPDETHTQLIELFISLAGRPRHEQ